MAQRKPFHPLSYSKGDLVRPNAFSVTFQESGLYLMCNKCTIVMPKSVAIPVPWMTGIMQLAGRQNGAFAFNVSLVSVASTSAGLILLGKFLSGLALGAFAMGIHETGELVKKPSN